VTRAAAVVLLVLAGVFVAPVAQAADLAGTVIVLDAGHGAAVDGPLTRQVPNGRGGTKDCQTTGTSTDGGYPEHTFNWDVVALIQADLNARGATTYLTRTDDSGPAACVDARAAYANAQHPNAIISIHADGGPPSGHGFHVNYSAPPVNDVQAGDAVRLATTMRDALAGAGFAESTYLGSGGLYGRADLAGLNLAEYPSVLVELGNMRNADDAAVMTTDQGRARYAAAVVDGIAAFVSTGV
jgi:N-acetylmuramoyl-L-alanine amidase